MFYSLDVVGLVFWALLICYLAAWALTMGLVTQAAREKGYGNITGKLWFIGLFGLIFTPSIIVAALPDKSSARTTVEDELPEV